MIRLWNWFLLCTCVSLHVEPIFGDVSVQFGHELRTEFMLDPEYTNMNHGSYGCCPKEVLKAQSYWRDITESNPDKFYRYTLFDELDAVRKEVASYVHSKWEDITFVENASEGMNAFLRSLVTTATTSIVYLDLEYFMVAETMRYLRDTLGATLVEVNTDHLFPVKDVEAFKKKLQIAVNAALISIPLENRKVCSFSHISSMPSIVLPVKELTSVCKQYGATVIIDGAHVMGNIEVNVPSIRADVYVSNGHKWFFTPKGAAFIWVNKELQPSTCPYQAQTVVNPTIISNEGQGESDYAKLFSWEGTKDYGTFLAFHDAIKWRKSLGDKDIMQYNLNLANEGGDTLVEMWKTKTLVPKGELVSAMVNVELPLSVNQNCSIVSSQLPSLLLSQYNTWIPVTEKSGMCLGRISAQIYNDRSDFEFLGHAVLDILQQIH